jgi:hypothetical protein
VFTYQISYTVETESEVSESDLETARDLGGRQISDSIEGSGGGMPTVRGVIQSGRPQE